MVGSTSDRQDIDRHMENRIRKFRKQREMTLTDLAAKIGTTPQSISRLENGLMTLSTGWLVKLADAFHIHPTDLLEQPDRETIPLAGLIGEDGVLRDRQPSRFTLEAPSIDPLAARLATQIGNFQAGDVLIFDRLQNTAYDHALDRDCLAAPVDGSPILCRVIAAAPTRSSAYTLVPLASGTLSIHNTQLSLAAPLIMRISFF